MAKMLAYEMGRPFGIDGLRIAERELPQPGPGQILVRMRAAALNYRDLLFVRNQYLTPIRAGLIPLCDGAGEVAALGAGVTHSQIGDRVIPNFYQGWISGPPRPDIAETDLGRGVDGTLCQYMLLHQDQLAAMPAHLSFAEAASLPCAGITAWSALFEGEAVRPGQDVLIQGTGGVSLFALQFAKLAGCRVIATTSSPAKAETLRMLGADLAIDYLTTPDWDKAVLEATGGQGVDRVIEVTGAATIARSIAATRLGGTVAIIGIVGGFEGPFELTSLLMGRVKLIPIGVGSLHGLQQMNRAVTLHRLQPVIDRVFAFQEAADAFRHLQAQAHVGKVVIAIE